MSELRAAPLLVRLHTMQSDEARLHYLGLGKPAG